MRFGILGVVDGFPFRVARFVLTVVLLSAIAFASDDVQQTDEDSRFLIKQSEKLIRKGRFEEAEKILRAPVSYTHLTLPTSDLV